jgi:hypothetical protein
VAVTVVTVSVFSAAEIAAVAPPPFDPITGALLMLAAVSVTDTSCWPIAPTSSVSLSPTRLTTVAPVTTACLPAGFVRSMTILPSPKTEKLRLVPLPVTERSSARMGRLMMCVTSSAAVPSWIVYVPPLLGRNTLSSS